MKMSLLCILASHLHFNVDVYSSYLPTAMHTPPQQHHNPACMADIIAQEQHASDDEGDGFKKQPQCQQTQRKQWQSMQLSVSVTSSLVDDNFFESLSANDVPDGLAQEDEEYVGTNSGSLSSESGLDSDEVEITNEEVCL